jgi:hypothetical protein
MIVGSCDADAADTDEEEEDEAVVLPLSATSCCWEC